MITHKDGTLPPEGEGWLFVFGSNEAGIHGAGAAKIARFKFRARLGLYNGKNNQSYAIPTKDFHIRTLSLDSIEKYVKQFIEYTYDQPQRKFWLTRVGCGLAGYEDSQIAPLFRGVNLENTSIPEEWVKYIGNTDE